MKNDQQLEALHEIRKMMRDSSKFLSLSGLSGVIVGIYGLLAAFTVHMLLETNPQSDYASSDKTITYTIFWLGIALLILAIATVYFLSAKKAKKMNQNLFDHTSKKVFWSMAIPLGAGGAFCLSLLYHDLPLLLAPVMLMFYGMSLLNSSKYFMPELKNLGLIEIGLGVLASFIPDQGLLLWALGFGLLHIIYGAIMWNKYDNERTQNQSHG